MKENDVSITFHIDKDLLKEFEKAKDLRAAKIGIDLNKKQALQLAIKDAIEKWTKAENTGE